MGDHWRPARVRCLEGGRAGQTPAYVQTPEGWEPLRLISESLVSGPKAGADRERIYAVEDSHGGRHRLRRTREGWLIWGPD